ncbi:hypothetical protein L0F63_005659 [Massospora cicadina]|nr:hypothetical protein L0F63_005659 [Massospora cicadina]
MYPNALLKQKQEHLVKYPLLRLDEFDMDITINTDRQFTYPQDLGVYRDNMAPDIIQVLTHEIIHGLGIFSFIRKEDFYRPYTDYANLDDEGDREVFSLSLFDTFLYDNEGNSIEHLIDEMNEGDKITDSKRQFSKDSYYRVSQAKQIGMFNKMCTTPDGIFFRTNTNEPVYLHTANGTEGYWAGGHLSYYNAKP